MYKALTNFSGIISMNKGEVQEISDKDLADKLIKAEFIEEISSNKIKEHTKITKVVKIKKK